MSSDLLKDIGDTTAGVVTVATVFKWLPAVAAIFTIVWTGCRIWEWFEKRLKKDK